MNKEQYIIGYIFEDKFFKTAKELADSTDKTGIEPIIVYNPNYIEGVCLAIKTLQERQSNCIKAVIDTLCPIDQYINSKP